MRRRSAVFPGWTLPRMYPLYGLCAKLRSPMVLDFANRERWPHHRPQVEVVAADFPELDILLALPPRTDTASILRLMQRFPRVSFLLTPEELQADEVLCDYLELHGRERALFRSSPNGWPAVGGGGAGVGTESGGATRLSFRKRHQVIQLPGAGPEPQRVERVAPPGRHGLSGS